MKMKKTFYIIYGLLCLLFFSAILEIFIRYRKMVPPLDAQYQSYVPDSKISYKHKPNSVVSGRSGFDEFDYEYRHNSIGLRDIEHDIVKKNGTYRILGLGDSFTYGAGAMFENTYLYQLEKNLNSRQGIHPKIEIIKAGISRSFPEAERLFLENYGIQYSPDLVLIGFVPNDIVDTMMADTSVSVTPEGFLKTGNDGLGNLGTWLYLHSHLWRFIRFNLFSASERLYWADKYRKDGLCSPAWIKIESEFLKMKEIVARTGAKMGIVYIPMNSKWDDKIRYPQQRIKEWAEKNSVLFIPTIDEFKLLSQRSEKLFWDKDGHCTPAGYKIIADTLFKKLTDERIVP